MKMNKVTRLNLSISGFISIILLLSGNAIACSCPEFKHDNDRWINTQWALAEAVFVGEVLSKKTIEAETEGQMAQSQDTVFKVQKVWKGDLADTVVLKESHADTCAYSFTSGQTYLVYANRIAGTQKYTAGQCSGTKLINKAGAETKVLDRLSSNARNDSRKSD